MSTRLPCVAIALIGPRASGKTTVSQALAKTLNCALVDTDTLLTTAYGTIREQFANHGETLFRDREERALVEALAARGERFHKSTLLAITKQRFTMVGKLFADGAVSGGQQRISID